MPGSGGRRKGGFRRRGHRAHGGHAAHQRHMEMMTNQIHMMADQNEVVTEGYWERRQGVLFAMNPNATVPPQPNPQQVERVMNQFDEYYTGSSYCIDQPVLNIINMLAVITVLAKTGIQIYTAVKFQANDGKSSCNSYFAYNMVFIIIPLLGVVLFAIAKSGVATCDTNPQCKLSLTMTFTLLIIQLIPSVAVMTLIRRGCFEESYLKGEPVTKTLFWLGVGLDGFLMLIVSISLIAWTCKSGHMMAVSRMKHIPPHLQHFYAKTTSGIQLEMRNFFFAKSKMPEGASGPGGMMGMGPAMNPQLTAMLAAAATQNIEMNQMNTTNQPQTFGMNIGAPPPSFAPPAYSSVA